jgi:hypothetical protein
MRHEYERLKALRKSRQEVAKNAADKRWHSNKLGASSIPEASVEHNSSNASALLDDAFHASISPSEVELHSSTTSRSVVAGASDAAPPGPPHLWQLTAEVERKKAQPSTEKKSYLDEPRGHPNWDEVLGYLKKLAATVAYNHIDPAVELAKIQAWHDDRRNSQRNITRKFLRSWADRIERPLIAGNNGNGNGKSASQYNYECKVMTPDGKESSYAEHERTQT